MLQGASAAQMTWRGGLFAAMLRRDAQYRNLTAFYVSDGISLTTIDSQLKVMIACCRLIRFLNVRRCKHPK